ncbi:MAG: GNAT family N-acetyltransferase [Gemmiger sp.]
MKHCGTRNLETERLLLRRLTPDDCEMMFGNWANDPEVTKYLRWNPHKDWTATMEYLNEIAKQYSRPDFYNWGICDKVTGVLMGSICIAPVDDLSTADEWKNIKTELLGDAWDIGYAMGKKWWNRGYMTEAAAAVRDEWFGTVGAPWLAGYHASLNVASSRVLAKTGFRYDHDTVLRRFDGTEMPCLAWYMLNPGTRD